MARNFGGGTNQLLYTYARVSNFTTACIAMWLKTTQTTVNACPISCWSGASSNGIGIIINNTANKVQGLINGGSVLNMTSTSSVNTGSWVHVAVKFVASGTSRIYVNGVEEATATPGAALFGNNVPVAMGDNNDTFWPSYVGDLAEVGMWHGASPDAAEIAAMAAGASPALIGNKGVDFFYAPLVNDVHPITMSVSPTGSGSTVSDHPRMLGGWI